ncbi:MAG TPA: amidohydrolase family protein [Nitrospirae bacterium]|nr:amidohydrolase family protein [Nitrospirota bacterium]
MLKIIDFHTHAFPDSLAKRAMEKLQDDDIVAYLDGRLDSLIKSMDEAGISKSVLCNIATRPKQFESILSWCKEIASDRIIPLPSVHPKDTEWQKKIDLVAQSGFKGIKLHPYYQEFVLDDNSLIDFYRYIDYKRLFIVMHTGFDIAFPYDRIADPIKVINVLNQVPTLKLITTHLGAWDDWEEVQKHIVGKKIYMEISFSLEVLDNNIAKDIITKHPDDYILFGTDSPWTDQKEAISRFMKLPLDKERKEKILFKNAERILIL